MHALERVDALAALGLGCGCRGGQGSGKPTCGALGGRVDQAGDGILAQGRGLRPRPAAAAPPGRATSWRSCSSTASRRASCRLVASKCPASPLMCASISSSHSPLKRTDMSLNRRIEPALQSIQAPIDGGQRLGRIVVRERLLQLGGDVGESGPPARPGHRRSAGACAVPAVSCIGRACLAGAGLPLDRLAALSACAIS